MKKIIFLMLLIVAIITTYIVNTRSSNTGLSDLALANIDALAQDREYETNYHLWPCPSTSGNECRDKDHKYYYRCSKLSYCR